MPKRFFKRYMPDHHKIRGHKNLRFFGDLLHDQNLWHLNRRSAAGGVGAGLFIAFIPIPFQMFVAAAAAILFRVNLPISVALVWVTNPLTMGPVFYFAYKIGAWTLRIPPDEMKHKLSMDVSDWMWNGLTTIWEPLLLGCFILGVVSGVLGYALTRLLWRRAVLQNWNLRKLRLPRR